MHNHETVRERGGRVT